MNGTTSGFFAVIFLLGVMLLVPTLLTGIASAENSSMNDPSVVRLLNDQYRFSWTGTSEPALDTGGQARYRSVSARPCSGDCDRCGARDYDRSASARDCDRCDRCPFVSGYRCDLYSCGWVRDYDCGSCGVR